MVLAPAFHADRPEEAENLPEAGAVRRHWRGAPAAGIICRGHVAAAADSVAG